MTPKEAWRLVKEAAAAWMEDRAPSMGAALSYYTVFSIAPLLLIVIAVAGLVFGTEAAQGAIVAQLQGLLGDGGARTIQELLRSVSEPKEGVAATIVGAVLLLIGATTVFAELQVALDRVWEVPERARPSGLWGFLRARLLSFGMILGIGFLLLVSLVISAAISALGNWWGPLFGGWETLAHVVNFAASFALVTVMFALIYRFMPDVRIEWHDVWIGAAVTALLFTIGKTLIGLYIGKSSVASGFGAAGSLAVLLLWVYYSAQIFLLGAEFTWVYAHSYGSQQAQPAKRPEAHADTPPAAAVPAKTKTKPAAPAATARGGKLASGIRHHPARAIGLAMVLGAVSAFAIKSWRPQRVAPHAATRPARTAAPADASVTTTAGKRVAGGIGAAVVAALSRSLLTAVRRGARRGWRSPQTHGGSAG